jgi:4-hydroxy-2-oxoheptanedioate aldolase
MKELFDANGKHRVLRGVSVSSGSERIVEFAGQIGFDAAWLDLEHGSTNFARIEMMCAYARAGGLLPVVRTASAQRTHVLRALEAGGRIVVVPLVNDAATARQVVEYGRFPPEGKRGYQMLTAGLHYGQHGPELFRKANEETALLVQIETKEAVANLDAICEVKGLAGILVGPGDLSADMGKGGKFDDPEVLGAVEDCILRARKHGKYVATFATNEKLQRTALKAGVGLVIMAVDFPALRKEWTQQLAAFDALARPS